MTTPTTNQYQLNGPTFAFCGTFSGTGTTSASRWLKKFEHELAGYKTDDGSIPPKVYLANLDMLLEDEASEWSESQPEAIRLLALADPTQDDVTMFKSLLCERFPSKAVELYPVPFSVELSELKQKDEESLNSYYKRVSTLMQRVGAKDRPQAPVAIGVQPGLSMLEAAMLDTILYAFIKGLNDTAVRKEATRAMTSSDRSLKTVYNTAEEARRTNIEIETMLREEQKADKLQFYMDLASRNVPKHQMDSLLAEYHAKKSTEGKPSSAWSFYVDPPQQVPEPAAYTAPAQAPAPIYTKPDNQRSVLTTNQNAQNRRTPGNSYGRRPNRDYEAKPLPAASSSKNPWINGSKQWDISKDGPLCYQCGNCGHIKRDCKDDVLPAWEQSHLKAIVFPNITAQANFVAAAYGEYDGHVYPYGSEGYGTGYHDQSGSSNSRNTPQTGAGSTSSNSIQVCMPSHTSEANSVEAYYGEGSGPNKRPHVEPEMNASNAGPSTSAPANPYPTFAGQYPQFQAQQPTEGRTRAKAQKKVGRKLEPQPLVGMFNDGLGKYDSPVSIRSLLQNNKVDISWMDLVAWSPAVAREIKRMCTRVSKKKTPRARNNDQPQPHGQQGSTLPPFQTMFGSQAPQQMPQAAPPMMPIPTFQAPPANLMYQAYQPVANPTANTSNADKGKAPEGSNQAQASQSSYGSMTPQHVQNSNAVAADLHTQFVSKVENKDKAWRFHCTIITPDGKAVKLERTTTQADQGSDINVISPALVDHLGLAKQPLSDIGFNGLAMRTADGRETILHHFVFFKMGVEDVWRDIRCFVAPTTNARYAHSLLLGIPWLWSVNAIIAIRESKILVGDPGKNEAIREVVGPELVFCKDHNILMYSKPSMATPTVAVGDGDSTDSSSSSESEDDIDDIEEIPYKGDF